MDLNYLWFFLVGVLLTGYVILDGFDFGVGSLHLFARSDTERRVLLNSIGPVWDGNEVWLVTGGGALFAAFPNAYAAAFSGFYLAFMLLLFALIFRAVAIEFRGKFAAAAWRSWWDGAFCVASVVAAVLLGVAAGNMIKGIPIGEGMEYRGTLLDLLGPYPLLVGVFALSLFSMHGSVYLNLKTEGELQARVQGWFRRAFVLFVACYVLTTAATLLFVPNATRNFRDYPWLWAVGVLTVLAIGNTWRAMRGGSGIQAFVSSSVTLAALMALLGGALFPNLIVSSLDASYHLDIRNAASSQRTLAIMRNIALIGMPFVIMYTAGIYWVFRGKVRLDHASY